MWGTQNAFVAKIYHREFCLVHQLLLLLLLLCFFICCDHAWTFHKECPWQKKKKKEWACWSYEFLKVLKAGDKDPRSEEIESLSKIAATYFFLHNMPFELKQSWEKCLAAFFLSFFLFKPDIIAVMPTGRRVKQAYFQNILECSASIW